MSIKEKMIYSRSEDHIYGLDDVRSKVVGEKPKIANKMLCFVIHGLSTKSTIPAGYYFHASLTTSDFYTLEMDVLRTLTNCRFIVLKLVTDNMSSNTALFKKLCQGSLQNLISHPFLEYIPLFLSSDYCHALKNSRNLFLEHDMCSSEGVISSSYLKEIYDLQKGLPIKPIKYLSKKHLYQSSFEKMNVLRAIQIFCPAVTSSLKFLKDTGDERFMNVDSTISYMKHMYTCPKGIRLYNHHKSS
ncbi:hypothetical protein Zmor_017552 [Zophobas morio]|uniref:Transposable element P transposase n=1 Tax=Zophobas morio TaxID=2755281 RepID=A0AA38MCT0_9CUCU|nr:hypothetical protein Zmor_017552 [Zophobas morio]